MRAGLQETALSSELKIPLSSCSPPPAFSQGRLRFIDCKPQLGSFLEEVHAGLASHPKTLEPKFFYDEQGSRLFEQICSTPEYYPTRSETEILETHAQDMVEEMGSHPILIEFGSGNSRKIRSLLEILRPAGYVAIEISCEQLLSACEELSALYPEVPITAVCADYCQPIPLPDFNGPHPSKRVAFFPGSTIGNFTPEAAVAFLRNVRRTVGADGGLLIGVDMKKESQRLNAAYNDSDGITAAFNLNLLRHINRELGGDFDLEGFRHHAFYNEVAGRIEMHLVSRRAQQVSVAGRLFQFKEGESIHTENSYKYTVDEFRSLAAQAGFAQGKVWLDKERLFSVHYLSAV